MVVGEWLVVRLLMEAEEADKSNGFEVYESVFAAAADLLPADGDPFWCLLLMVGL